MNPFQGLLETSGGSFELSKLPTVRSRLCRSQISQANTRWKAFDGIYQIDISLDFRRKIHGAFLELSRLSGQMLDDFDLVIWKLEIVCKN